MMLKQKINILLLLICAFSANSQVSSYRYKREISGVNTLWHKIRLPQDIYQKTDVNLSDIRIYGSNGKDTIEVPYLLIQHDEQIKMYETAFKLLNESFRSNEYFYTFQSAEKGSINQVHLAFKQKNFDWKVTLEGSNDNQKWFTILKDARILSIKNSNTDYHFTQLNFPDSKYQYFRIAIKSVDKPLLVNARIMKADTTKGVFEPVKLKGFEINNNVKTKETDISVSLIKKVPVSSIKFELQNGLDFYRPVKIEYVTDSFKTEKGIQFNYAPLYEGTISSVEKNEFTFPTAITSQLKVTIENRDNQPLHIKNIILMGNPYELYARFDDLKLHYDLFYGKDGAIPPDYDITNFQDKVPANLTALTIANEENISAPPFNQQKPLFENKAWLWVLMAVIVALLGWFSFKMLRD